MKVTCIKKSAMMKAAAPGLKADGSAFVIVDNEDSTATVNGVDAAGYPVDITSVATLAVTSDDATVLSVDPPAGMTFKMHGLKPAANPVNLNVVATWNDGSMGPFAFTLPCSVVAGGVTGIQVVPGTPLPR